MKINHLGIAVNSIEEALKVYCQIFPGIVVREEPLIPGSTQRMVMIDTDNNGLMLELLEPLEPGVGSIGKFLEKRGEGIHHIAYETDDIYAKFDELKALGYRVLGEVSEGAGGSLTFFVHPKDTHGVLTEYVSENK